MMTVPERIESMRVLRVRINAMTGSTALDSLEDILGHLALHPKDLAGFRDEMFYLYIRLDDVGVVDPSDETRASDLMDKASYLFNDVLDNKVAERTAEVESSVAETLYPRSMKQASWTHHVTKLDNWKHFQEKAPKGHHWFDPHFENRGFGLTVSDESETEKVFNQYLAKGAIHHIHVPETGEHFLHHPLNGTFDSNEQARPDITSACGLACRDGHSRSRRLFPAR